MITSSPSVPANAVRSAGALGEGVNNKRTYIYSLILCGALFCAHFYVLFRYRSHVFHSPFSREAVYLSFLMLLLSLASVTAIAGLIVKNSYTGMILNVHTVTLFLVVCMLTTKYTIAICTFVAERNLSLPYQISFVNPILALHFYNTIKKNTVVNNCSPVLYLCRLSILLSLVVELVIVGIVVQILSLLETLW